MEDFLARQLFGDPTPDAKIGGEKSDTARDPVGELFYQQEFGLKPSTPATAAPVRKSLTIEEIEAALRERRRKSLIQMGADLLEKSRPVIRAAIIADLVIDRPEFADRLREMK